jgi:hypothetical protein
MDEILADYNETELELLAGFPQKVTATGVIAADDGINQPQEKWCRDILRQTFKLALMDDSQKRKSRLELGHVLFIDIAGYSTLK